MTTKGSLKDYRDNLLTFIDWLDENKMYMRDDVKEIEEIGNINAKQWALNHKERYADKRKFDEYQKKQDQKIDELTWDKFIPAKAKELKLYDHDYTTLEIKNRLNIAEHLEQDIKPREVEKIIDAKDKYLAFRKDTELCVFRNGLLFSDLDEALIEFFGAFTDVSDMKRALLPQPSENPLQAGEEEPVIAIANNFDKNNIDTVIDYFRELERYMKEGEFMEWMKQAFETMQPERKFLLIGKAEKQKVRKIFYNYWVESGKKHGTKERYVRLLSDYFEAFPYNTTASNFAK